MARIYCWLLLYLFSPLCIAQTIYTWTDSQGVVHFSDTPASGEAHNQDRFFMPDQHQPSLSHQASEPTPALVATPFAPAAKKASPPALAVTLASPQQDQTIRDNRGRINIAAQINRKLMVGEQLQLQLDGQNYGAPQTQLTWQLKNIDRGTHSLTIKALRSGKLIASTDTITVHLHRAKAK